ncbi:MAG: hypothetical protein ACTSU6_00935 [Candidatus Njordarchaeales archaeon]
MPLSSADRIAISKKLVEIPKENATALKVKSTLEDARVLAENADDAIKTLMDDESILVNAYQAERELYNGEGTDVLAEQDLIDAVDRKFQNLFFPNDPATPLPSIADGIWKNFVPFAGSGAIGKNYDETFTTLASYEQFLITDLNAKIATVEGVAAPNRSTGLECSAFPSDPTFSADTTMVGASAGQNVKDAVQTWEDMLNTISSLIPTVGQDPNVARQVENDAARADITAAIAVIDTWQALADYDPVHGTGSCAAFDALDVSTLNPSKFRAAELDVLKTEITARTAFIPTRISQTDTNLGSITQTLATGAITATSGFYGSRFRIIDMRLNLIGGTLNKLKSIERAQDAQDELIAANDNAEIALATVMEATAFRAPAAGTGTIHVLDASAFSVSDAVYVVADDQSEISTTISVIDGDRVVLADAIPLKYRQDSGGRLYKVL